MPASTRVAAAAAPDRRCPVTAASSAAFGRNTSVYASTSRTPVHRPAGSQLVSSDVVTPAARARANTPARSGGERPAAGRTTRRAGAPTPSNVHVRRRVSARDGAGQREDRPVRRPRQDDRQAGRAAPTVRSAGASTPRAASASRDERAVDVGADGGDQPRRDAEPGRAARGDRGRPAEHQIGARRATARPGRTAARRRRAAPGRGSRRRRPAGSSRRHPLRPRERHRGDEPLLRDDERDDQRQRWRPRCRPSAATTGCAGCPGTWSGRPAACTTSRC